MNLADHTLALHKDPLVILSEAKNLSSIEVNAKAKDQRDSSLRSERQTGNAPTIAHHLTLPCRRRSLAPRW